MGCFTTKKYWTCVRSVVPDNNTTGIQPEVLLLVARCFGVQGLVRLQKVLKHPKKFVPSWTEMQYEVFYSTYFLVQKKDVRSRFERFLKTLPFNAVRVPNIVVQPQDLFILVYLWLLRFSSSHCRGNRCFSRFALHQVVAIRSSDQLFFCHGGKTWGLPLSKQKLAHAVDGLDA